MATPGEPSGLFEKPIGAKAAAQGGPGALVRSPAAMSRNGGAIVGRIIKKTTGSPPEIKGRPAVPDKA